MKWIIRCFIQHLDVPARSVVKYLESKDLISFKYRVPCVRITTRGIDEIERVMAQSYAAKEFRVLKTIHETKHKAFNGWVNLDDLERELPDIPRPELFMILKDLEERKGLIGSVDQAVWIVPAGIEELEQAEQHPNRSTQYFPAQIINNYTLNVQGDNRANIQQGTHGSTQNITLTNNPDIDQAIRSLLELLQASSIPDDDKEEIQGEIDKVSKLALKEPAPGLLERAKNRLDLIKVAVTGTDIAIKAAPHLDTLWELIKQRFGG